MSDKYILVDGRPVACDDLMTWAKWFETSNRLVAKSAVGDVRVSTVFLGLDHSFGDSSVPILYESMIFGGPHDQDQRRYATKDEALQGHAEMLELVKGDAK